MTFEQAIEAGQVTSDEAAAIFDSLPPVSVDFMLGTWRGSEFPSGHPNDGQLSASGWFGKRFKDAETVDPLMFHTQDRKGIYAVDPIKMKTAQEAGASAMEQDAVEAEAPAARLRIVEYRGVPSAAMIYDAMPINDHFRKVDDDTVLGAMDARGDDGIYFFVLRREPG